MAYKCCLLRQTFVRWDLLILKRLSSEISHKWVKSSALPWVEVWTGNCHVFIQCGIIPGMWILHDFRHLPKLFACLEPSKDSLKRLISTNIYISLFFFFLGLQLQYMKVLKTRNNMLDPEKTIKKDKYHLPAVWPSRCLNLSVLQLLLFFFCLSF